MSTPESEARMNNRSPIELVQGQAIPELVAQGFKPTQFERGENELLQTMIQQISAHFADKIRFYDAGTKGKVSRIIAVEPKRGMQMLHAGSLDRNKGEVVVVYDRGDSDLLDVAGTLAHELSHSTADERQYIQQSPRLKEVLQDSDPVRSAGRGLENGFALLDEFDLKRKFAHLLPKEVKRRKDFLTSSKKPFLRMEDISRYGQLSEDEKLFSLKASSKPNWIRQHSINLDINLLKNYYVIRELCKKVGIKEAAAMGLEDVTEEDAFKIGRKKLEASRLGKGEDMISVLVDTLGTEAARKIILLQDIGMDVEYDEALDAVKQVS